MAVVSGTISGAFPGSTYTTIYIEWSTSADQTNNTSTLTASLKVKKVNSSNVTWKESTPYSLTINGTVVKSGTISINFSGVSVGTVKTICTYTKTYTHGSDGTLAAKSISGIVDLSGTTHGKGVVPASGTSYVYFDIIPRGCDLTSYTTSANIGTVISVTIDRKSSSFTHTATISLSGASSVSTTFTSGTGTITDNTTLVIPTTWANVITGTSNSSCVLTVVTKDSSSTVIDTITKKFTTTIPSSTFSPSISALSVSAVNGTELSSSQTVYVNTKTSPKVTVTASAKAGATLKTVRIKASDGSYDNTLSLTATTATSFTLPTITSTTGRTYTLTVTDSRGYSTSSTSSAITIQDYNPPTLTSFTATRCNSDGSANTNGTSIKVTCTYTYSSCSSLNSASCVAKLNSNTTSTLTSGTGVVVTGTLSTALNGTVYVTFGDKFTSATYTKSIGTLTCPIDIAPNNKGVAIGGVSQEDGYFDVYSPMKTRNSLIATNGIIVATDSYNGTTSFDATPLGLTVTYNSTTLNGFPAVNCTLLTVNHSSYREFQIASQNNGSGLYYRSGYPTNTGGTGTGWSAWTKLYADNNPPSASDVGAYAKTEWDSSKGTNGYCKMPTGVIIQWGYQIVAPTAANTVALQDITFPIAFPSSCRGVQITPRTAVPNIVTSGSTNVASTGFTISMTRTNTTETSYSWFAIGY